MAGIGMLSVGILGGPFIGFLQERSVTDAIELEMPSIYADVIDHNDYLLGAYSSLNSTSVETLPKAIRTNVEVIRVRETQGALAKMIIFPAFMLVCYLFLILYFKSKGGYRAKLLQEKS